MSFSFRDYIREAKQGEKNGIFIDDSGSPGVSIPNSKLHPERKSWVAVIVPHWQISEVVNQFEEVIPLLEETFGVNEFHFADIYGKRGKFENVPLNQRLAIFKFMASIFQSYLFPIIVQTFDPITHADVMSRVNIPKRIGPFNLENVEDLGLLFLLWRLSKFIRENPGLASKQSRIFVDEGYKKNGVAINLDGWKNWIADGLVCFAQSHTILPIQLADFAAFSLNRSQIIINKPKKSDLDIAFLEILSPIAWNYQNIPKFNLGALESNEFFSIN